MSWTLNTDQSLKLSTAYHELQLLKADDELKLRPTGSTSLDVVSLRGRILDETNDAWSSITVWLDPSVFPRRFDISLIIALPA